MTFDGKAFGAEIVHAVKAHVSATVEPMLARLDALEKRLDDLSSSRPDNDPAVARVEQMSSELHELRDAIKAIELPTVDPEAFRAVAREEVEAAVKSLQPKDGKDADEETIVARVSEKMAGEIAEIREALNAIPIVELPDIPAMVKEAVAAIPAPKDGVDGKSITDIDVSLTDEGRTAVFTFMLGEVEHSFEVPLVPGPKGEKGDPGEDGRDGVDVTDLFRAEDGRLIAVLGNGTTKDLGVYVGKDGEPGKDGRDGLGFDDMRLDVREEGTYLVWERGEVAKEAFLPVPFYRGVWSKDAGYRKGNTVTWGGSTWIATKDSPEGKPDTPDSDWVLSNKRGRDGKDAK